MSDIIDIIILKGIKKMTRKGNVVYKKIWKKVDNEWVSTHLIWTRAGDVFKVEGDDRSFMMVTDPEIHENQLPKIKYIKV
jgi:hypothetical protein